MSGRRTPIDLLTGASQQRTTASMKGEGNGRHDASRTVSERYGAFGTADGRLVIYDTSNHDAWIMASAIPNVS